MRSTPDDYIRLIHANVNWSLIRTAGASNGRSHNEPISELKVSPVARSPLKHALGGGSPRSSIIAVAAVAEMCCSSVPRPRHGDRRPGCVRFVHGTSIQIRRTRRPRRTTSRVAAFPGPRLRHFQKN